jgi:hypothetical protein
MSVLNLITEFFKQAALEAQGFAKEAATNMAKAGEYFGLQATAVATADLEAAHNGTRLPEGMNGSQLEAAGVKAVFNPDPVRRNEDNMALLPDETPGAIDTVSGKIAVAEIDYSVKAYQAR